MMTDRSTWQTPFYANIFSYVPSETRDGYPEMDEATLHEVAEVSGYLGYEVVTNGPRSIFISYWQSMEAVNEWRKNTTHKKAKSHGKEWYAAFHSMLCKIEEHRLWNPEMLG